MFVFKEKHIYYKQSYIFFQAYRYIMRDQKLRYFLRTKTSFTQFFANFRFLMLKKFDGQIYYPVDAKMVSNKNMKLFLLI